MSAALRTQIWQYVIAAVCLVVLAGGVVRQILPQTQYQIAFDFLHNIAAAQAILHGNNPYAEAVSWLQSYTPGSPLESYYVYAPAFAHLIIPFTFLPLQVAISLWAACNVAFLFVTIYALLRAAGARTSVVGVLVLVTAASLMAAVRFEVFLGNVDIFMLAAIAAALWARQERRPVLAGVLLAVALTVKPMLLLIALFLLWKREFKFVSATLISFGVLFITPYLWLGGKVYADLLLLWRFYSNQYLSFGENVAVRGLLERLFTVNAEVQPVVVAPLLATGLWLVIAAVLLLITLAIVAPKPLQRDSRSLVEMGAVIAALLLASPLTESGYLVLLIIPLLASLLYLRDTQWGGTAFSWATLVVFGVWVVELLPRGTEAFLWAHLDPHGFVSSKYFSSSPLQFYVLVAAFLLQLYVLGLASGRTTPQALAVFLRNLPQLLGDWIRDARRALPIGRRPSAAHLPT